jgi:hypothetical protein
MLMTVCVVLPSWRAQSMVISGRSILCCSLCWGLSGIYCWTLGPVLMALLGHARRRSGCWRYWGELSCLCRLLKFRRGFIRFGDRTCVPQALRLGVRLAPAFSASAPPWRSEAWRYFPIRGWDANEGNRDTAAN